MYILFPVSMEVNASTSQSTQLWTSHQSCLHEVLCEGETEVSKAMMLVFCNQEVVCRPCNYEHRHIRL